MTTLDIALYLTDPPTEVQVALFYHWNEATLTYPAPLADIEEWK